MTDRLADLILLAEKAADRRTRKRLLGRILYLRTRERIRAQQRQYRINNKERILQRECERRKSPRSRAYARAKRKKQDHLHPERRRAYWMVKDALKYGRLKKKPCESCGATRVHAHHDDYAKPLSVRWLCVRCHVVHPSEVAS